MKYLNSKDFNANTLRNNLLIEDIVSFSKHPKENEYFLIRFNLKNCSSNFYFHYSTEEERDKQFLRIEDMMKETRMEQKNFMKELAEDIKNFISENRNVIYTILGIVVIDQILLKGALSARIQKIFENLLSKLEGKVGDSKVIDVVAVKS